MRSKYAGLLYISPWLAGFFLLTLYPFASSLYYSFTQYNIIKTPVFVGWQNFIDMFTKDPDFTRSLKVTFQYVLLSVPLKLAFALLVALVLNLPAKGMSIFRTLYYLPSILGGSIAVSVLWKFLFMREGIVNKMFLGLGLPAQDWLGDPKLALFTIALLPAWEFGSSMIIFLAGLKQIPQELYEAARVDGATRTKVFSRITLPLLAPVIVFNLVMQTIGAFQQFTAAFVITGGGPVKSTYLYGMLLYDNAFHYFKMGYASALSWVLFLILLAVTFILMKASNRYAYYEDGGTF